MTDPDWIRRLWTRHTGVGHRIENLLKGTAILTTKKSCKYPISDICEIFTRFVSKKTNDTLWQAKLV